MSIPDNNFENDPGEIKRFRRGRKPGQKKSGDKTPKDKNDRPNLTRFSVSLPVALGRVVRSLNSEMDLRYSQIFRKGLDLVVKEAFDERKITIKTYDHYKAARDSFHDDDFRGE